MDTLDERLIDILDDALNAEDATKQKTHHTQALAVVADYLAYVDGGDPFLEAIADNGFVELNLLSVLKERLAGMKQQLEAAAA